MLEVCASSKPSHIICLIFNPSGLELASVSRYYSLYCPLQTSLYFLMPTKAISHSLVTRGWVNSHQPPSFSVRIKWSARQREPNETPFHQKISNFWCSGSRVHLPQRIPALSNALWQVSMERASLPVLWLVLYRVWHISSSCCRCFKAESSCAVLHT